MVAPVRPSWTLRSGEHSHGGDGRCGACRPSICPSCNRRTLHNVGGLSGEPSREEVCENGCTTLTSLELRWQADMKEALYQFERREARRRKRLKH